MKVIQSSLFRAVCAMAIGVLLIKYRDNMATWLVIAIGVLFFLSGVVACVAYYVQKNRALKVKSDGVEVFDGNGNSISPSMPSVPIAGIGSVILGGILAFMPVSFVNGLVYIFSAILILGAINQFVSLVAANRIGRVGWMFWVMPSLLLLASIYAVIYPQKVVSDSFFFLGWVMLIFGIVECINALKVHRIRTRAAKEVSVPDAVEVDEKQNAEN